MPDESNSPSSPENEEQGVSKELTQKNDDIYVVGIGASAGGLEALEEFFRNMPGGYNLAFIVVQHLSPDYKSLMVELLSKHTPMQVFQAENGMAVEANHVYLIPRKKNMTIFHRKLYLSEQEHTHGLGSGLNLPIDIFLQSLAEDQGEKSMAVILSGTGSDGTRGVRAIKDNGGIVMVQEATDAKFDGMPKSAIATQLADYVLTARKMPEQILNYLKHPYVSKTEADTTSFLENEDSLSKILALLRNNHGLDFTYYKQNTIIRRIERRLSINQIEDIDDYVKFISQSPLEVKTLYKELLIGVTNFFRDPDIFEYSKQNVIPKIFEEKKHGAPIRIWVAGCSTGEEAYSIAILFKEYAELHDLQNEIKIFATDVDKDAIEYASAAVYPESIVAEVSAERLQKFFIKKGQNYYIAKEIREMVIFATHNLIKDPPFSKVDFISCRNLLIYLQVVLQKKILSIFSFSLIDEGFLLLGSSETIGDMFAYYEPYDTKSKIYRYRGRRKAHLDQTFSVGQLQERGDTIETPAMPRGSRMTPHYTNSLDNAYEVLFEHYVPPCVFIDGERRVIHVVGDVNQFVKIPQGRFNFDIVQMVRKDLSVALSTSLHKARKDNKKVIYKDISVQEGERVKKINLIVRPAKANKAQENDIMIILFDEIEEREITHDDTEHFDIKESSSQRMYDLEQELQYTKENLQATIEELETSNEELQATNEELIAANEELQNTNEELQSVNEELITVNSEHQMKIQELTELNSDMNNLLSTTDIGVIFLDKNLRIRKFTSAITKEVNLINLDIGRPLSDISHNLRYDSVVEDAKEVVQSLETKETEVQNREGVWYHMKILPYRTVDNFIKGAIITLLNIDRIKHAIENARILSYVDDQSPNMIMVLNDKKEIQSVNKTFTQFTGHKQEEIIGKSIETFFAEGHEKHCEDVWEAVQKGAVVSDEFVCQKKSGEQFDEQATIIPIKDEGRKASMYYKISRDISEQKSIKASLDYEREIITSLMQASPVALTVVEMDGTISYANTRAEEMLGLAKSEIAGKKYNDPTWQSTDIDGKPLAEKDYPFVRVKKAKKALYDMCHGLSSPKGDMRYISVNGAPIFKGKDTDTIKSIVFAFHLINEKKARILYDE